MIGTKQRRLRTPAVMAIGGSAIAVAALVGSGWTTALSVEVVTLVATVAYYVIGGRDSDVGAVVGSRADERQATIAIRATALAGNVMCLVALGGFIVSTALGREIWPWALFTVVGAASYVAGSAIYRWRG